MKFYFFASAEIHPNFISRSIMKVIGAEYCHVGHIVDKEDGSEPMIYHATFEGYNKKTLSEFLQKRHFKYKIDFTKYLKVSPDFVCGYLEGNLGKDYSQTQFIGFIPDWDCLKNLKKILRHLLDNNEAGLICSEATTRTAELCTTLNIKCDDEDYIDPKEFMTQLLKEVNQ